MLILIGLCAFVSSTCLTLALGRRLSADPVQIRNRLEDLAATEVAPMVAVSRAPLLRMQGYSSLPALQRLLQGAPRIEQIADSLDRAGVRLQVGQFLMLSLGFGVILALGALAWLPAGLTRVLLVSAAFLFGLSIPRWFVRRRIRRRRARFEALLPDALDMIGRSLRMGAGLMIAIGNMVEQMSGPIADAFGRLQREIGTGLPVEEAFRELDRRVASKDLHIVVTAILVQREVGGNLAEILGNVSAMMRERVRLRGEAKALASRQLFSTYGMAAVPPLVIIALIFIARPLVQPLFDRQAGWLVLGIAALLECGGLLIVKLIAASPIEV